MAPLLAGLNTYTSRSKRSPKLSPSFQMPHVFVIPPEEEQQDNPPWCCFDADQPQENSGLPLNPNIHSLDVPCPLLRLECDVPPLTARTSTNQLRPKVFMSKKLEKRQRPEAVQIVESRPSQARRRDSDVIEVVKVKRSRGVVTDLEENTNAKRPKTLRARATKALQSIKNVGKSSHRTHLKELWTSTESTLGVFKGAQEQFYLQENQTGRSHKASSTKKGKGSISQSYSRSLSQIFQPTKPSPPELSSAVYTVSSASPTDVGHIPTSSPLSHPHFTYNNVNSSLLSIDDTLHRQASLNPSTKKNMNAKFSVRELHRLFSLSSSSPEQLSPATVTTTSFLSAPNSCTPSAPTPTLLSGHTDAPTELHFFGVENADRKFPPQHDQALHTPHGDNPATSRRLSDISFEMKLDSLHFDSLSFNPDDFDVSMEGNEHILW